MAVVAVVVVAVVVVVSCSVVASSPIVHCHRSHRDVDFATVFSEVAVAAVVVVAVAGW